MKETVNVGPVSPYGHAACVNVLNDLDDALDNEESSVPGKFAISRVVDMLIFKTWGFLVVVASNLRDKI